MQGRVKVNVHYFEEGNVQLDATIAKSSIVAVSAVCARFRAHSHIDSWPILIRIVSGFVLHYFFYSFLHRFFVCVFLPRVTTLARHTLIAGR